MTTTMRDLMVLEAKGRGMLPRTGKRSGKLARRFNRQSDREFYRALDMHEPGTPEFEAAGGARSARLQRASEYLGARARRQKLSGRSGKARLTHLRTAAQY